MLHNPISHAPSRRTAALAVTFLFALAALTSTSFVWGPLNSTAHAQEAAAAPLTQLSMSGEPNDYIGGPLRYLFRTPDSTAAASAADRSGDGTIDYVQLSFGNSEHGFILEFSTSQLNKKMEPGLYLDAQRAAFADSGHPGMDIFGDGRGCNQVAGNFRIHEAEFDTTTTPTRVVRFTASFEQHCEGGPAALLGTVHYNSVAVFPGHDINGRVARADGTGVPNVEVLLGGSRTSSRRTDANGNFTFPNLLEGGHYRLIPAAGDGHLISPESISVKNLLEDVNVAFTSVPKYTISGKVRNNAGSAITGVFVSLSGAQEGGVFTDDNGNYSFTGLPASGTYTVTPNRQFYGFTPPSRTFHTLPGNQTVNFTGNLRKHSISGRVINNLGVGVAGVTMTLGGARLATAVTNADGNYSFTDLTAGGSYSITPGHRHYTFQPPSMHFFELAGNFGDINFTAFRAAHTLSGLVLDGSGNPLAGVEMILTGTQSGSVFTDAAGQYVMPGLPAGGNYTVMPSRQDHVFGPSSRSVVDLGASQSLNFVGNLNPVHFFVRQHYLDFLSREPDAGGLEFWSKGITDCGTNEQCVRVKRVDTSAAFFLSIEFQETGYLVYRMYKAAYGDAISPGVPGTVPVIRREEFLPDKQRLGEGVVVGAPGWPGKLEENKAAFALEFVGRGRFLADYPESLTPAQFVDRLNQRAGGVLSAAERAVLVEQLTAENTASGRAKVLRAVADDAELRELEFNRAFVLMQYFGYLQRNPDEGPDVNFGGWRFWLDKLNQFNGDFRRAEMVRAFIESIEYADRFRQ